MHNCWRIKGNKENLIFKKLKEVNAAEKMQDKFIGEKEEYPEKHMQQVHRVTEDIIDEETGKIIGQKTTSTINPIKPGTDVTPTPKDQINGSGVNMTPIKDQWTTPKQPKLRDVMQKAMGKMRSTGRRPREVTPIETPKTSSTMDGLEKTELLNEDGKPMIRFTNFTSNMSALEEHDTTAITNTTTEGSTPSNSAE